MKILICRGNRETPKSYPYWDELLALLKDHEIKEITGILSEQEIIDLVNWSDTYITVDSFLPHLCNEKKLKPGVVIWGLSDPKLFGFPQNTNLLKGRMYLRPRQFLWWKDVPVNEDAFVKPEVVLEAILSKRK
jgi:hypothetical protein